MRILEATTPEQVEAAAPLYDGPPLRPATDAFLADPRHHLLVALDDDGCYGMWVGVDIDNAAAHSTYRAAGGHNPELCDVITWTFGPA